MNSGKYAEQSALSLLQNFGLKLVAKNWYAKGGELDLVMLDADVLVFVEVRYRRNANYGDATASINLRKQRRIILAAEQFLAKHPDFTNYNCRFDVVVFDGDNEPKWLQAAFDCC